MNEALTLLIGTALIHVRAATLRRMTLEYTELGAGMFRQIRALLDTWRGMIEPFREDELELLDKIIASLKALEDGQHAIFKQAAPNPCNQDTLNSLAERIAQIVPGFELPDDLKGLDG